MSHPGQQTLISSTEVMPSSQVLTTQYLTSIRFDANVAGRKRAAVQKSSLLDSMQGRRASKSSNPLKVEKKSIPRPRKKEGSLLITPVATPMGKKDDTGELNSRVFC